MTSAHDQLMAQLADIDLDRHVVLNLGNGEKKYVLRKLVTSGMCCKMHRAQVRRARKTKARERSEIISAIGERLTATGFTQSERRNLDAVKAALSQSVSRLDCTRRQALTTADRKSGVEAGLLVGVGAVLGMLLGIFLAMAITGRAL